MAAFCAGLKFVIVGTFGEGVIGGKDLKGMQFSIATMTIVNRQVNVVSDYCQCGSIRLIQLSKSGLTIVRRTWGSQTSTREIRNVWADKHG